MRPKIPTHRVDKAPEYVPITDLAWDKERIAAELEDAEGLGDKIAHPFFRYHRGETRFDLDAADEWDGKPVRVREYLGDKPETWKLRRLELEEWYEIEGLLRSLGEGRAFLRACRLGVVGVDNYQGPKLRGFEKGSRLVAADIKTLADGEPGAADGIDVCGVQWPLDPLPASPGRAVADASAPPTEAERKQSGF